MKWVNLKIYDSEKKWTPGVGLPPHRGNYVLQVNLIITLSLGSMETDRVISEPCYNEVIYNRYITK